MSAKNSNSNFNWITKKGRREKKKKQRSIHFILIECHMRRGESNGSSSPAKPPIHNGSTTYIFIHRTQFDDWITHTHMYLYEAFDVFIIRNLPTVRGGSTRFPRPPGNDVSDEIINFIRFFIWPVRSSKEQFWRMWFTGKITVDGR